MTKICVQARASGTSARALGFHSDSNDGVRRGSGAYSMQMKLSLILGAAAVVAVTPATARRRGDEPIAVPRTVKQGIDFVYVDPQMSTVAKRRQRPQNWLQRILNFDLGNERQRNAPHPLFFGL